jgi:hypothetical protein
MKKKIPNVGKDFKQLDSQTFLMGDHIHKPLWESAWPHLQLKDTGMSYDSPNSLSDLWPMEKCRNAYLQTKLENY